MAGERSFSAQEYRAVMGNLPTGVVVISAVDESGDRCAMTIGSFGSVSLDPPLVMFMPTITSKSWQSLQNAQNGYCINVLGSEQEGISLAVASHRDDKLSDLPWTDGVEGNPRLDGCLAYVECDPVSVTPAGDHLIVVCEVRSAETGVPGDPLVFFRGGFGSFRPRSLVSVEEFVSRTLRPIGMARQEIADLAEELNAFVTVTQRVGRDIVPVASAGDPRERRASTQIGARMPFKAPLGAVAAAWASPKEQEGWVEGLPEELRQSSLDMLSDIRERGYAFTVEVGRAELEGLVDRISGGIDVPDDEVGEVLTALALEHRPLEIDPHAEHELRAILVPVFGADGDAALTLAVWSTFSGLDWMDVERQVAAVQECARKISELIEAPLSVTSAA